MLPEISLTAFIKSYRLQPELWKETVFELCTKHRMPIQNFEAFTDGSNLIASVADQIIVKIFPPFHQHQFESEHQVLQHLKGKLQLPVPEMIAFGECNDGWTYIIMTKLKGVSLESIWNKISVSEKEFLLNQIGKIMKEVAQIPVGTLINLQPQWNDFIRQQLSTYYNRHVKNEMPEWFLKQVKSYIENNIELIPVAPEPVILTGEYTPFNLLVTKISDQWNITGMIDFGDSMIGFREYDLVGPLLFLTQGNPLLIKSLFSGYGYAESDLNKNLKRRLMVLSILHRYSNLKEQIRGVDWINKVRSIEELEDLVFGVV